MTTTISEVVQRLASYDGTCFLIELLHTMAAGKTHAMFDANAHETMHLWAAHFGISIGEFSSRAIKHLEGSP